MRVTPAPTRWLGGFLYCRAGSALSVISLLFWAMIIFLPLAVVFAGAVSSQYEFEYSDSLFASLVRSFALAAAVAAAAVFLGYVPGRVLGSCRNGWDVLLLLLLMPLVLPRYLLYYAWTLPLSPTTQLGMYVAARAELARIVYGLASCSVLILWYWPVASLLIAQGWRNIDRQIWDCAALDGGRFQVFARMTLPLLGRPILLAFGVCFVLSLSEFATFHLAGIPTVGTELAVLYEQTGSESSVAAAAAPVVLPAVLMAIVLSRSCRVWRSSFSSPGGFGFAPQRWQWAVLFVLLGMSLVAPLGFLVGAVKDTGPFEDFLRLHSDELAWSFLISVVAAVIANLIAYAVVSTQRASGAQGSANRATQSNTSLAMRFLSVVITTTIFIAMFVPACLIAVSLLRTAAVLRLPSAFRQDWYIVSAGQASRFAGVALILLLLARHSHRQQLTEMASVDGASAPAAWWHVHLPHTLPVIVGSLILITMLGLTELSATMVLLPAGLPNFAQRLLNQMHYAREQQVIASCLLLALVFVVLAVVVVLLLRAARWSGRAALVPVVFLAAAVSGCDRDASLKSPPYVLACFGRTGRGQSEFVYPRAIDIAADGTLFVVDKTGRIQHLTGSGRFLNVIEMPLTEAGKPTGLSVVVW